MNCRQKLWLVVGVGVLAAGCALALAPKLAAGAVGGAAIGAGTVLTKYAVLSFFG